MHSTQICATKLRDLRLERGLSVAELADRSALNPSQIYRMENGVTTRPFIRTLRLLAKALKVEVTDLLAADDVAA